MKFFTFMEFYEKSSCIFQVHMENICKAGIIQICSFFQIDSKNAGLIKFCHTNKRLEADKMIVNVNADTRGGFFTELAE